VSDDEVSKPEPAAQPDAELQGHIDTLTARGEHAAAAAALWAHGFAAQAGAIYEHIFEDERALKAYEAADDVVAAMRVALRKGDSEAVERIVAHATSSGRADPLLGMLEQGERHAEVARIHLVRGDLELAAEAFERAGRWGDAASAREQMGDLRAAGVLYERHLEADPDHPASCLALGKILARFSRHDDAVTLLQRSIGAAADKERARCAASPTMVLSFTSLGYDEAARAVWERWQEAAKAIEQELPASLEDFLRSDSAAAFAAVVSRQRRTRGASAPAHDSSTGLDAFFEEGAEDIEAEEAARDTAHARGMLLAGRYLLSEPLGGGGVGQVFRAFDAFTDQPVAVKIFGSQAMQSEAVQSYAREARAAAGIGHHAIARLVELNMPQGYLVTELVAGESAEQRLRRGGDAAWLAPFSSALLDLLGACHRTGLVHGALKPTNVFLVEGGVRVVDFGAHHLLALRSTETGGLSSVWPYLAPEQLFGAPADVGADLYALGAILYRALTSQPPFARAEDDRREAPRAPSLLRGELAGEWDAFLLRALSPRAGDRFVSADEMREAMPPVPRAGELLRAESLGGDAPAPVSLERTDRYAKGPLVYRDADRTRVYEGRDLTVGRPVWIVETEDADALAALAACARLLEGVQPVYDVLPEAGRAVVARDAAQRQVDLASLREVPQALARDLGAVAAALDALHEAGLALGGFEPARVLGPIGPRIRFAPAPVPVPAAESARRADWESFGAFVALAFGASEEGEGDARARVLDELARRRLISPEDRDALAEKESWSALLDAVTERLIAGNPGRVMARLVRSAIRGA
jgi:tetratricopeptide (TPR) repeat protein